MQNESITTGQKAREERRERASKMCLTAGVCVGVMGHPVGPRGNLRVCALALQDLAGVLLWRCHNCVFFVLFSSAHTLK